MATIRPSSGKVLSIVGAQVYVSARRSTVLASVRPPLRASDLTIGGEVALEWFRDQPYVVAVTARRTGAPQAVAQPSGLRFQGGVLAWDWDETGARLNYFEVDCCHLLDISVSPYPLRVGVSRHHAPVISGDVRFRVRAVAESGGVSPWTAWSDLVRAVVGSGVANTGGAAAQTSTPGDHGGLTGLLDDDHSQYLTTPRHDTTTRHPLGTVVPHDDHGALSGLADDDHTQYLNTTRHDTTDRHGATVVDHGAINGLGDDDHGQYLNNTRHDTTTRHTLGTVVPHDDHGSLVLASLDDDDHGAIYPGIPQAEHITGSWSFDNVEIRGELHTPVFVRDLIEAHAGTILLAKSAGSLAADMVVPGAGTWTMTLKDPPAGGFLFDNSDICRCRGDYGAGIGDTWFTVASRTDNGNGTQSYTCTWVYGTQSVTYGDGLGVVDYGVSGQGLLLLTAELSGAPYYAVLTHGGHPWAAYPGDGAGLRLWAKMGNLNGSYGVTGNYPGFGVGDYASDEYLAYDSNGKLRLVTSGGGVAIGLGGIFLGGDSAGGVFWKNGVNSVGSINVETLDDMSDQARLLDVYVVGPATGTAVARMKLRVAGGASGTVQLDLYSDPDTEYAEITADFLRVLGDLRLTGSITQSTALSARVYKAAAFTHNSNGNWLAVSFDTERWDDGALFDAGSPTRLTAPVAGVYQIHGHVTWAANATGNRQIAIRANGTTFISGCPPATGSAEIVQETSTQFKLAAGGYVELMAYQNSGGNLNIQRYDGFSPEFVMTRLA